MVRSRSNPVKEFDGLDLDQFDDLFLVWLNARATSDLLDTALASTGLTADEFAIYSVLQAGPTTPTKLAVWMAVPPTTVSSYVKRFESRGDVLRETSPHDRRSYRVRLTPAGRRAHRRAAALFDPVRSQVAQSLGPRQPAVREALLTLREALDHARRPTPGGHEH